MTASSPSVERLSPESEVPMAGPGWWQAARRRAAADMTLPTSRDEAWKYTSLKPLRRRKFQPLADGAPVSSASVWCKDDAVVLEFIDGVLRNTEAVRAQLPDGVKLQSVLDSDSGWARSCLEKNWQGAGDALARLNTAQCSEAWYLRVEESTHLETPIVLEYSSRQAEDSHPRLLLDLGPGSELRMLESIPGAAENAFNNVLVQVKVGKGAVLEHICAQQGGSADLLITRWDVEVTEAGRYENLTLDLGGQLVRHDLNIDLTGLQATTSLRGVYPLSGRQHVDNHSRVHHQVGDTHSRTEFRGVMTDRSRAVFNGKALIAAGADGSDVVQSNANLLLSEHAEIDTKPELEIYADDVTASHGATVGQLQEEAVFYLQSRGIPESQARRLLTRGFLQAVTRVPDWLDAMAVGQAVADRVESQ